MSQRFECFLNRLVHSMSIFSWPWRQWCFWWSKVRSWFHLSIFHPSEIGRLFRWPGASVITQDIIFLFHGVVQLYSLRMSCRKWLTLNLLDHIRIFVNHIKLWLGIIVKVDWFVWFDLFVMSHLWLWHLLLSTGKKRLKNSVRIWLVIALCLTFWIIISFRGNELMLLECTFILLAEWVTSLHILLRRILLLIKSHDWSWLMLFSHHLNSLLRTI